jgi:hypothetical protein
MSSFVNEKRPIAHLDANPRYFPLSAFADSPEDAKIKILGRGHQQM